MNWGKLVGNVVKGAVKTGLFAIQATAAAAESAVKEGRATSDKYSAEDYSSFAKKVGELKKKIKFDSMK